MNIETPLISVVIPCYNDGIFLPETIARLKEQTYQKFEIIVVNDGSTDAHTKEVLNALKDKNIKVLHKENGRMSSARNYGVKHAAGTLIAALDADDYFHPTFFEKAIPILQKNTAVAVVTSHMQLFGEVNKVSKPRGGNEYNFLFSNQCPACAIVRKQCWDEVGGYDEEMKNGYEDWEFYIRITQKGWTIEVIPEKLFFYRQTKKSTHKNDTLPNRSNLINYIVSKHQDWYLEKLKELITNEEIIYKKTRISYPFIADMIINRVLGKY
ncbi:MAG TPA: glycosyltransferase family A protein [Chondromyces sp.]|jgi:glycosyltransferase involved in cell wall biosynthesis|nr:glycosyltransferase family A protein [Chondromyces sp.]